MTVGALDKDQDKDRLGVAYCSGRTSRCGPPDHGTRAPMPVGSPTIPSLTSRERMHDVAVATTLRVQVETRVCGTPIGAMMDHWPAYREGHAAGLESPHGSPVPTDLFLD